MGETLYLFMMDGDVNGRLCIQKTKSNCYMYKLSRQEVDKSKDLEYINTPGVYFLFGRGADSVKPYVYVGQGEHCLDRSIQPHPFEANGASYWTEAVYFVSNDNHFDQGTISYLENRFWNEVKKADRYILKNAIEPHKPTLKNFIEAPLEGDIVDAKTYMASIGYPVFVPSVKGINAAGHKDDLLYLTSVSGKWNAMAVMSADGFVVLKGSVISNTVVKSCPDKVRQLRKAYKGKISSDNVLLENIPFSSPSYAADFVSDYSMSGQKEWKNKNGKSLGELSGDDSGKTSTTTAPAPAATTPSAPSSDDAMYLQYEWNDRNTKQKYMAKCKVVDNIFTVLSGSQIRMTETKGLAQKVQAERNRVKKDISSDKSYATIKEDVPFTSASTAGGFVDGGSCDGMTAWKDANGKTLKELVKG